MTEYIQSNYYENQKPTGKPSVITWLGSRMVASHSVQAICRELTNMSANQDMISINIIGKQSSGKSQLIFTIQHLCHKFAKTPYQCLYFGKHELLHLEETMKNVKPINAILAFDDIAFLKASATTKELDVVQDVLARIRHLPGGKDIRIILLKSFQYSKSISPFMRQAEINIISTVDFSDDIESLIGKKHTSKLKHLAILRDQGIREGKFIYKMGGGKKVIYEWSKPFRPFLYVTSTSNARIFVSPLRQSIDPICNTCSPSNTAHQEKTQDVKEFLDNLKSRFKDGNTIRTAVKIKLIQQGVNAFSPKVCQAVKLIDKVQQEKIISIDSLAAALELTPTRTSLFPERQVVKA
jgi:hypothetical protein